MVVGETHHFRKPRSRGVIRNSPLTGMIHPSLQVSLPNKLPPSVPRIGWPAFTSGNPGTDPRNVCEADFSNKKNAPRFDVLVGCLEEIITHIPSKRGFMVFFLGGEVMICLKREPRYSLANWVFVILASIPAFFTYTLYGTHIFSHPTREGFICSTPKCLCW